MEEMLNTVRDKSILSPRGHTICQFIPATFFGWLKADTKQFIQTLCYKKDNVFVTPSV